jgi:hypothetical protein
MMWIKSRGDPEEIRIWAELDDSSTAMKKQQKPLKENVKHTH